MLFRSVSQSRYEPYDDNLDPTYNDEEHLAEIKKDTFNLFRRLVGPKRATELVGDLQSSEDVVADGPENQTE